MIFEFFNGIGSERSLINLQLAYFQRSLTAVPNARAIVCLIGLMVLSGVGLLPPHNGVGDWVPLEGPLRSRLMAHQR